MSYLQSEDALGVFGIEQATVQVPVTGGSHTESRTVEVQVPATPGVGAAVSVLFVGPTGGTGSTPDDT